MYLCHCRGVSDCAIRDAISAGARTIDDIARQCAAGSRCGGCWPALAELLASCRDGDEDVAATHAA